MGREVTVTLISIAPSLRDMGTVGTVLRKLHGLKPGLQPSFRKTEAGSWVRLRLTLSPGIEALPVRGSVLRRQPPPAGIQSPLRTGTGGSEDWSPRPAGRRARAVPVRRVRRGVCSCSVARGCALVPQQLVPQDLLQDLLQAPGSGAAVEQPLLGREVGGTARGGAPSLGILRQQMAIHLARALLTPVTSLTVGQPQLRGGEKRCTHTSALKPLLLVVGIVTKAQTSSLSSVRRSGGKGRAVAH